MSSVRPSSSASQDGSNLVVPSPPNSLGIDLSQLTPAQQFELAQSYYEVIRLALANGSGLRPTDKHESDDGTSQVSSASVSSSVLGVGLCYLRAVVPEHRQRYREKFGMVPTIELLMGMPRRDFLPDSVLRKIRVRHNTSGVLHVGSDGEHSFLQVAKLVSQLKEFPRGSLAAVSASTRDKVDRLNLFQLSHRVGMDVGEEPGEVRPLAALFEDNSVAAAGKRLRKNPTMGCLLSLPVGYFKKRSELLSYGFRYSGREESVSVARPQPSLELVIRGGYSWLRVMRYYVAHSSTKFPDGSIGSAVAGCFGESNEGQDLARWPGLHQPALPVYGNGMCYLQAIEEEHRGEVAMLLGPKPVFLSLLELPYAYCRSLDDAQFLFVEKKGDEYHVGFDFARGVPSYGRDSGTQGECYVSLMGALARRPFPTYGPGSLGARAVNWPIESSGYYDVREVLLVDVLGSSESEDLDQSSATGEGSSESNPSAAVADGRRTVDAKVVIFFLSGREYAVVLWDPVVVGWAEQVTESLMRVVTLAEYVRVARTVVEVVANDGGFVDTVLADRRELVRGLEELLRAEALVAGREHVGRVDFGIKVRFRVGLSALPGALAGMPSHRVE